LIFIACFCRIELGQDGKRVTEHLFVGAQVTPTEVVLLSDCADIASKSQARNVIRQAVDYAVWAKVDLLLRVVVDLRLVALGNLLHTFIFLFNIVVVAILGPLE
jgi:hypothetical protein